MVFDDSGSTSILRVDLIQINVTYTPPADITKPTINITFPINNTNSSKNSLDINYTRSDAGGLTNCWYSNDTYLANTSLGTTCENITSVVWSDAFHNVTIWANDTSGNFNFTRISFEIDTLAPNLNITYPINNSNFSVNPVNVNFTFSDAGVGIIDSCWYTNDTNLVNISLGNGGVCTNITGITWSNAIHNVTIYVNDTLNNVNVSLITFNVSVIILDTCTYTSGSWNINCADNCVISSNVMGSNPLIDEVIFSGLGNIILNANISNFFNYYIYGNTGCNVTCERGNCIQY
jgi:hypothetical protein